MSIPKKTGETVEPDAPPFGTGRIKVQANNHIDKRREVIYQFHGRYIVSLHCQATKHFQLKNVGGQD